MEKKLKELEETQGLKAAIGLAIEDLQANQIKELRAILAQREKALEQAVELAGLWLDGSYVKDYYMGIVSQQHAPDLWAYLKEKEGKK